MAMYRESELTRAFSGTLYAGDVYFYDGDLDNPYRIMEQEQPLCNAPSDETEWYTDPDECMESLRDALMSKRGFRIYPDAEFSRIVVSGVACGGDFGYGEVRSPWDCQHWGRPIMSEPVANPNL